MKQQIRALAALLMAISLSFSFVLPVLAQDSDGDSIPDDQDACPYEPGSVANNGCPETIDSDGDGVTEEDGDCDDNDASIHPGAVEVCDGVDDNCSGSNADEAATASELA